MRKQSEYIVSTQRQFQDSKNLKIKSKFKELFFREDELKNL